MFEDPPALNAVWFMNSTTENMPMHSICLVGEAHGRVISDITGSRVASVGSGDSATCRRVAEPQLPPTMRGEGTSGERAGPWEEETRGRAAH